MENIIKELEEKAMACSMSNKESRARKGAYVDAIVMMKQALRKPVVSGQSELLIAFLKWYRIEQPITCDHNAIIEKYLKAINSH